MQTRAWFAFAVLGMGLTATTGAHQWGPAGVRTAAIALGSGVPVVDFAGPRQALCRIACSAPLEEALQRYAAMRAALPAEAFPGEAALIE